MNRWIVLLFVIGLTRPVVLLAAGSGAGQAYPIKPVRLVVGYAPGGPTDIMARALSQKLSERLGQQVIVDNRAGAGGVISAVITANSAPDGYTLLMGNISVLATNPSMYTKLPYNPLKDFSPVTLTASTPFLVTINPALPVNTLREFIALVKAKPGHLNFGSSGSGGGVHLAVEMFMSMASIKMIHVPYKGAAPALIDLMSGQLQMVFSQPAVVSPHVKTGKLRILAITSAHRSSVFPNYPTIAESGVPGYEAISWTGIVAPAGTPKAIVTQLQTEIATILRTPEVSERLVADASEPGGNSPSEFERFIKTEIVKWAKVVKDSGAKLD